MKQNPLATDLAAQPDASAEDIIRALDTYAAAGRISRPLLETAWSKAESQPAAEALDKARLYELKAVILTHRGAKDEAVAYLLRARNLLPKGQDLLSDTSRDTLSNYTKARVRRGRRHFIAIAAVLALVVVPLTALAVWANSDEVVIANADPAMVALADRASMTAKGKAAFLRADPKLLSQAKLKEACAGSNVANDAVDGCYDPLSGRIYIRDMPKQFDEYEAVVAAHEMLHASFANTDTSQLGPLLDAEIQRREDIQKELKGYTFESTEARWDELRAHLGSQAVTLPTKLDTYYAQYFVSRSLLAKKYADTLAVFTAKENELTAQADAIEAARAQADRTYALHELAAMQGNTSLTTRYYAEYSRQYDEVERMIDEFNKAVDEFNSLVELFSGQPLKTVEPSRLN